MRTEENVTALIGFEVIVLMSPPLSVCPSVCLLSLAYIQETISETLNAEAEMGWEVVGEGRGRGRGNEISEITLH